MASTRWAAIAAGSALFCAPLFGVLAAGAAHAGDGKPMPGYWETTSQATMSKTKTERRCLVASEITRFLTNPENSHYTCTYPQKSVGGGRVDLKGSCVDKNGQTAQVSATGNYSPTAFHMDLNIDMKMFGLPVSGGGTTDAHRLGDVCPPDAIRSKAAKAEEGSPSASR